MNNPDNLVPTEREAAMLRALTADPSLFDAFEQLARIPLDGDPDCYSTDQAEERIHALGESLKLSSMTGWAQNAAASMAASMGARPGSKRSKKSAELGSAASGLSRSWRRAARTLSDGRKGGSRSDPGSAAEATPPGFSASS